MGPEQRIYTQGEMYSGATWSIIGYNKKGKPQYGNMGLDPYWYKKSQEFYNPPKPPEPPKPAKQEAATLAQATGSMKAGIQAPKSGVAKTSVADLRIKRGRQQQTANTGIQSGVVGSGLNYGGYA